MLFAVHFLLDIILAASCMLITVVPQCSLHWAGDLAMRGLGF